MKLRVRKLLRLTTPPPPAEPYEPFVRRLAVETLPEPFPRFVPRLVWPDVVALLEANELRIAVTDPEAAFDLRQRRFFGDFGPPWATVHDPAHDVGRSCSCAFCAGVREIAAEARGLAS